MGKKLNKKAKELDALVKKIIEVGISSMSPLTFEIYPENDVTEDTPLDDQHWYIDISEGVTELLGGKSDGARVVGGFSADIADIVALLSPPTYGDFKTCPVNFCCEPHAESPNVAIEGVYAGVHMTVTIYSVPISDEITMTVDQKGGMRYQNEVDEDDFNEDDFDDEDDDEDDLGTVRQDWEGPR